jgi:hypothetical protein
MKVTSSIVSALTLSVAVGSASSSTLRRNGNSATRSLQYNEQQQYLNNQWYYNRNQQWGNNQQAEGNYMDGEGQMYENFEEYMRAQMMAKTFSFTGCSTVDSGYGKQGFVTYRLCDNCSSRKNGGCDNSNGDYVVNMQEFAETYREYHEQVTGQEGSPFDCVR